MSSMKPWLKEKLEMSSGFSGSGNTKTGDVLEQWFIELSNGAGWAIAWTHLRMTELHSLSSPEYLNTLSLNAIFCCTTRSIFYIFCRTDRDSNQLINLWIIRKSSFTRIVIRNCFFLWHHITWNQFRRWINNHIRNYHF